MDNIRHGIRHKLAGEIDNTGWTEEDFINWFNAVKHLPAPRLAGPGSVVKQGYHDGRRFKKRQQQ